MRGPENYLPFSSDATVSVRATYLRYSWSYFGIYSDEIAKEYNAIPKLVPTGTYRSTERAELHQKRIDRKIKWFKELARRIDNHFPQPEEAVSNLTSSETLSGVEKVDLLCNRFHTVVSQLNQLKRGQKSPSGPAIKTEYDVQELLHALLWIFFSDIRREDPVPQ